MMKSHLAGLIVAATIAGAGATAWAAEGGPSTSTPAPAASAPRQPRRAQGGGKQAGGGLERRMIHGDLIVKGKDGTFQNVTVDRGTLQTKGANSLTLKRPDGQTVTVKVDANTKYRGVSGFDGLQTGKPVIVASHDGTAQMVAQKAPGTSNPNGSNVGSSEEQVPAT